MADPKIFVFAPADDTGESHARLQRYGCDLILGDADWHTPQGNNEEEMIDLATDADALMGTSIRSSPITRAIMESSPNLRVVAKCTVGTDDIDVDAATELGILVTHAPTESNCYGVAEGTVAMILNRLKKLSERDAAVKSGKWRDPALMGRYLGRRMTDGYEGMTLGIIGLGRIGARVSQLFQPWGMRIIAHDPFIEDERFERKGAEKVELDYLLENADIVSVHCTHNRTTDKFMNAERFAKMKPDAIFINTSRGGNVDEAALADALKNDVIGGAAIDAFADEPLPADSPLRDLGDKISMSAHMVSSNLNSGLGPGYKWATQAVLKALNGEVPNNVFNPEVIEKWKERFGGRRAIRVNEPVEDHPGYGPVDP
jgi:phosphoglycerate dehydrogenase-like enzyme